MRIFAASDARHRVSIFGPWGVVALVLGVAMAAAIVAGAPSGTARLVGCAVGVFVGFLAIAALPSLSKRVVVLCMLGLGGFVLARHVGGAAAADGAIAVFAVAAVAAVVLTEVALATTGPRLAPGDHPWRRALPRIALVSVLVFVGATVLAPFVARAMHQDIRRGTSPDPFSDPTSGELLSFTDQMDTHVRPRLSDRVVMTVDAQRPAFWRGTTFDVWDGRRWTRASDARYPQLAPGSDGWDHVYPAPEDPAPDHGIENRQTFTMAAPYSELLFAAASPVAVRSDRFVGQMVSDGSLSVGRDEALGRGTSYTVLSREPNATSATLRAAPTRPVPRNVAHIDLEPGPITARVRTLAHSLAAGSTNAYDTVQRIMTWLGTHTEYSLDAPLPPEGVHDSVDWFLFGSHRGWCEQISTSLAVMLRANGVPARVATGFATGTSDPVTGRYTVRERDAHAWTEVYFPGIGWQGFDPTSAVPLAGATAPSRSVLDRLGDHLVGLLVVAVGFGIALIGVPPVLRAVRARRARRATVPTWAAETLAELERIGARHQRPRRPDETPTAYAAAVAAATRRPELVPVGVAIDDAAFGPTGDVDPARRRSVDEVLVAARDC